MNSTTDPHELKKRSDELEKLSSEKRLLIIEETARRCAMEDYNDSSKAFKECIPLFQRPGINGCHPLQEEIIRLAVEYADMVLFKDHMELNKHAKQARLFQLANKEIRLWTHRAHEILADYKQQMIEYSQLRDKREENTCFDAGRRRLLGSIIGLACATKERLSGFQRKIGDIPSDYSLDTIADEYLNCLCSQNANRTKKDLALTIVADHLAQLRQSDRNYGR